MNTKQLLKDMLGWGILLWLIGYILGMIFFFIMSPQILGWVILPIGTIITLGVLITKVKRNIWPYYLVIGLVWTSIAIAFDYLFIVKAFHPVDGYYKPDVYLYYVLTFILPIIIGIMKQRRSDGKMAR